MVCSTILLYVTENILREIDTEENSVLILLDYLKVFDTIKCINRLVMLQVLGCLDKAIASESELKFRNKGRYFIDDFYLQ